MTSSCSTGWRVGIDVGGSSVRVVAQDPNGVRGRILSAPVPQSYDCFVRQVTALVGEAAAAGRLAAVGCGLPGTSDGDLATFVPALPWIADRTVRTDLSQALGAPVSLALDGHLTLLAEAREGAAAGLASAVLVAVGTGIGGALMLGGKIWRGRLGSAGSWGWLPAAGAVDDPEHGGFEQRASGSALSALGALTVPPLSSVQLVEAAREGDRAAADILQRYGERLGRGLAAIASMLDPDVVLVGGGLSAAMDVLAPFVQQAFHRCASPDGAVVPVRATALGPHAGVVGALHLALDANGVWL